MTPKNIEYALAQIEEGRSQREIAKQLGIAVSTLNEQINKGEYSERSARARSISAEAWLDRGFEYVLDEKNDPQRARIVAQECARRAAIRNPRYRDKGELALSNPDGSSIKFVIEDRREQ